MKIKISKPLLLLCIGAATLFALFDSCEHIAIRHLYQVEAKKCIDCKKCLSVCPEDAIIIVNGKAIIDKQECIGCGRCLRVCPESAIYPVEEATK
jgi:Fe-S-cluster-containing hydrogenase component 2